VPTATPVLRGPYFGGGDCDDAACALTQGRRRMDIDEDNLPKTFPDNNILEAEAVLKGGSGDDVGAAGEDEGDQPIGTQYDAAGCEDDTGIDGL
jgi:hypothetical protein